MQLDPIALKIWSRKECCGIFALKSDWKNWDYLIPYSEMEIIIACIGLLSLQPLAEKVKSS